MTRPSYRDLLNSGRKFTNQPVNYVEWKRSSADEIHREMLFFRWQIADDILKQLEDLRDEFTPNSADEEPDVYIFALCEIPQARERARELWLDYAGRSEQHEH